MNITTDTIQSFVMGLLFTGVWLIWTSFVFYMGLKIGGSSL